MHVAVTVLVISASYTQIIETFPSGGGAYVVASKFLGRHAGLVAGSALLIDYVLTIAVSLASGAHARAGLDYPRRIGRAALASGSAACANDAIGAAAVDRRSATRMGPAHRARLRRIPHEPTAGPA